MVTPRIAASLATDARRDTYDRILASRPSAVDAHGHLAQIEADLRAIEESTAHLRRRRNEFISVARLPPDLLALVFECLASIDPLIDDVTTKRRLLDVAKWHKRGLCWITITHVCSFWRTVAIQDARLWSQVPGRLGYPWVNEIMRRHGEAGDLTLEYTYGFQPQWIEPGEIISLIEQNLHYVEDLRVMIDDAVDLASPMTLNLNVLYDPLLRAILNPAPRLHSLFLHTSHVPYEAWPYALFSGQAPHLTRIYLHGYPTSPTQLDLWSADLFSSLKPLLPQLTDLSLDFRAQSPTETCRFGPLHDALSAARKLERLDIRGYLFASPEAEMADETSTYAPLELPCMRELRVIVSVATSASFASLLDVPDTCTLEIGCYVYRSDRRAVANLSALTESLSARFASVTTVEFAARRMPCNHLAFSGWYTRSCELLLDDYVLAYPNPKPPAAPRPAPNVSITLHEYPTQGEKSFGNHPYYLSKLLAFLAIPLRGIENLSLRVSDGLKQVTYASPDWTFIRDSFKSLQWLRADGYIASQLLRQQWFFDEDILTPSVMRVLLMGVDWEPEEAQERERRQQSLRRLLQMGDDVTDLSVVQRSAAVGGRIGASHEGLVLNMSDILFTVFSLQANTTDGEPDREFDSLHDMYEY
ncbi:unnamed protein product [Peniophora sp. CBMAI 1063]|nr:unnamed protein product [Peniophora sp. CBMAI 1063]